MVVDKESEWEQQCLQTVQVPQTDFGRRKGFAAGGIQGSRPGRGRPDQRLHAATQGTPSQRAVATKSVEVGQPQNAADVVNS